MNTPRRPGQPVRSVGRGRQPATPAPGVVETIADGLTLVLVYPIVLLLPVLIDAGFWLGMRVSPSALMNRFSSLGDAFDSSRTGEDVAPVASLFVPSLLGWVERDDFYHPWTLSAFTPGSWGLASFAIALLLLASSLISIVFRVPLALIVRRDTATLSGFVRAAGIAWARTLALVGIVIGIAALITSPFLVVGGIFLLAGVNVLPLFVAVLTVPVIAAAVYLHFTPDAIVVSQVGPLRAIYLSFNIVRRNLWATLGLLGCLLLISEGLPVLWLSQADTPIGLLLGVLGNAFFGAGLALATMRFYLDRLHRWLPEPALAGGPVSGR